MGAKMTKHKRTAKELAEEHWNWLEELLLVQRRMERRLFIDSFIHGYKHGKESKK